jgi:hypothetical protein
VAANNNNNSSNKCIMFHIFVGNSISDEGAFGKEEETVARHKFRLCRASDKARPGQPHETNCRRLAAGRSPPRAPSGLLLREGGLCIAVLQVAAARVLPVLSFPRH